MIKMRKPFKIVPMLVMVIILALMPLAIIACGDSEDDTAAITAKFSASKTTGVAPVEVVFTDESTSKGDITEWLWDFGDGDISNEQSPTHIYDTPGLYTVILTVTGDKGTDIEAKSQYISATAIQYAKVNLKLVYAMALGQDESKSAELFAQLLEKYTGGAVDVTVFGGGTLYGYGEDMTAVKNGAADITWTNPFFLRMIKPWLDPFYGIPDLVTGFDHARAILADGRAIQLIDSALLTMGWKDLGFFESVLGGGYFNTVKETKDITDMSGMKIGSLYPGAMTPTSAWAGVTEVVVGSTGELTALAAGQFNLSGTSWSHVTATTMIDTMKHALLTENFSAMIALMNPAKWNSLEPALQKLIKDTIVPEVQAYAKSIAKEGQMKSLAVLKKKMTTLNIQTPARAKEIYEKCLAESSAMQARVTAYKDPSGPGAQIYDILVSLRPASPKMSQDFKDILNFAGVTIPAGA